MNYKRHRMWAWICVVAIAVGTTIVSLSLGAVHIPVWKMLALLASRLPGVANFIKSDLPPSHIVILISLRLPRVLATLLVGAGLACAGACMQGIFRNPMASPYVVGVSQGAALGAALALFVFPGLISIPVAAFAFGLLAVFLVYQLAARTGRAPIETLLLAGIAVGFFFSAITSLLMYARTSDVHRLVFWTMGGFSGISWQRFVVALPLVGLGIPGMFVFARDMNILQLGEENAVHLGVQVERAKLVLLILASLVTAAAVSVSGVIGFVGLIVPHAVRLVVGPDHRLLLPASVIAGALFVTWCDVLARVLLAPVELPVGIITACFGAPFFIYLLVSRRWRQQA